MPSERDPRPYLFDILRAIEGIAETLYATDLAAFRASWATQRAVERGIEIISEASRRLPDSLKATEGQIVWRQIAGIGNVLRHEYGRVDEAVIFTIATTQLQGLDEACRRMMALLDRGVLR